MDVDVVIEDPRGSTVRHHWNAETGTWVVQPHSHSMDPWPANYGYIPGTHNPADGDDLDILVLSQARLETGAEIRVRPVGVLHRPDGDDKILGVLIDDPDFGAIRDLVDVPAGSIRAIEDWFAAWSEVGTWSDAGAAFARIALARKHSQKLNGVASE